MASPQKEKGFTPIAHEILDEICQFKFNGAQFRILMKVWRMTYGYSKKDHDFSHKFLQRATRLSKSSVKKELAELIKNKVLIVTKEETNHEARMLAFNKNYDEWGIPRGSDAVNNDDNQAQMDLFGELLEGYNPTPQNGQSEGYDSNPLEGYNSDPQSNENSYFEGYDSNPIYIKRSLKKLFIEKKNEFEYFYSTYPRKISKAAAKRAWEKLSKEKGFDAVEIVFNTMNFAKTCKLLETPTNFIPHPSTYLNQKRFIDYPVVDPEGLAAAAESKMDSNLDFFRGQLGGGQLDDAKRNQPLTGKGMRGLPE